MSSQLSDYLSANPDFLDQCLRDRTYFKVNYLSYFQEKVGVMEPKGTLPSLKVSDKHTTKYNPKNEDGAPVNGASVNVPSFPDHHVNAVLVRANAQRTPENKRIAAYAVGMSLDLLMQYMREQSPDEDDDIVQEFRYMLQNFAEWAGFEEFDAFNKKV